MSKKSWFKKFLSKWAVVILGVSLTICSAVISNYFIAKHNDRVSEWEKDASNMAQQIEEVWENSRSMETRKNTAIQLLIMSPEHPQAQVFIKDTLALFTDVVPDDINYAMIEQAYAQYKEDVIEQINDKYLLQQSFLEQAQLTKMDIDTLSHLALSFQILGLIFVLSRGII